MHAHTQIIRTGERGEKEEVKQHVIQYKNAVNVFRPYFSNASIIGECKKFWWMGQNLKLFGFGLYLPHF